MGPVGPQALQRALMPWFPDFVGAVQLVRAENRTAGHVDPVGQYFTALNEGDSHPLEDAWSGEVVIYDPRAGEIRGHRRLRQFVMQNQSWMADRQVSTQVLATTSAGSCVTVELLAHMNHDGRDLVWPVAVVVESPNEQSVVFRTYCSQWPVDGRRHVRPPILESGHPGPGDVVGRYHAAQTAGDTEAIVATFAPNGYLREFVGEQSLHAGHAALRSHYARCFSDGGIGLEYCSVLDDGVRCVVEYNCVRWGSHELPPQAGIAVYERGADGLLAAARRYDDVQQPR
jgi:ketosteroid isomerase-like protein